MSKADQKLSRKTKAGKEENENGTWVIKKGYKWNTKTKKYTKCEGGRIEDGKCTNKKKSAKGIARELEQTNKRIQKLKDELEQKTALNSSIDDDIEDIDFDINDLKDVSNNYTSYHKELKTKKMEIEKQIKESNSEYEKGKKEVQKLQKKKQKKKSQKTDRSKKNHKIKTRQEKERDETHQTSRNAQ